MTRSIVYLAIAILLVFSSSTVMAMDSCKPLVRQIKIFKSHPRCNGAPTVRLKGAWKNSFSAAFRWDDGSREGQDRHPKFLDDSSAQASPYKSQRRIRSAKGDFLCYKRGLKLRRLPKAEQITIKRTVAPVVDRFCVQGNTFRNRRG